MVSQKRFSYLVVILVIGIFLVPWVLDAHAAFNYVLGREVYPVPGLSKPDKGVSYIDSNFNTTITRVTDRVADGLPEIWQGSSSLDHAILIPEYARSDCENADGTKLIITLGEYSLFLYDAKTYEFIKCLSSLCGGKIPENDEGSLEPRWDDEDPNVFYYVQQMGFYKYDISTDTVTLIRDFSQEFPNGWLVITDGEGEPSWDRRYWAFSVREGGPDYDKTAILTYDLEQDSIVGLMNEEDFPDCQPYSQYCGMNTVTVSPYGDRVVVEWTWPSPTISYGLDFTDPVPLGNDGHSDLGIDAEGNQVHVIKDDSNDVIAILDLNTGERTNIIDLPLGGSWTGEGGYHISGNNYDRPGWAVISTYGGNSDNWHYFQVFMLELKESPRIWRIAHTHGAYGGSGDDRYWSETKATINRKGTRIYWGSNWGTPSGDVDTYQAILPETWWEDLGGTSPTTFIDVPSSHWAHDYIEALYQGGYVAGCNTDPLMYCPDQAMTRAESAVFVERGDHGADYLPPQPAEQIFADVPLWEWFANWTAGLWNDGYTDGCETDPLIYCPLQGHTRKEGCVFFLRMKNGVDYVPPDPQGIFADVSLDDWGAKWIEAAYNEGLIPACETEPELRFCPDDPLDRAMGAYMMVQAKGLDVP